MKRTLSFSMKSATGRRGRALDDEEIEACRLQLRPEMAAGIASR